MLLVITSINIRIVIIATDALNESKLFPSNTLLQKKLTSWEDKLVPKMENYCLVFNKCISSSQSTRYLIFKNVTAKAFASLYLI